jgi:hypothetical protein
VCKQLKPAGDVVDVVMMPATAVGTTSVLRVTMPEA